MQSKTIPQLFTRCLLIECKYLTNTFCPHHAVSSKYLTNTFCPHHAVNSKYLTNTFCPHHAVNSKYLTNTFCPHHVPARYSGGRVSGRRLWASMKVRTLPVIAIFPLRST